MSTSILDAFDRTDENPLSGNWPANIDTDNGDLVLTGNQVTAAAVTTSNMYYTTTFGPNCEAFVTTAVLPGTTKNVALWLRVTNPGTATPSGYVAFFVKAVPDLVQYARVDAGAGTVLGANDAFIWAAGDVIGLRMVGNTLQAYQNGIRIGTGRQDTTHSGAGKLGLGGNDTTLRVDNFGGGDVNVASAPSQRVFRRLAWGS